MALKRTTWGPDTCGCRIAFEIDTAAPEVPVPDWVRTLETCPAHVLLAEQTLYEEMLAENRRKNVTLSLAKDIDPDLTIKDSAWSWSGSRVDDQRVLVVVIARFNPTERGDLQAACDLQFGPDLVIVQT